MQLGTSGTPITSSKEYKFNRRLQNTDVGAANTLKYDVSRGVRFRFQTHTLHTGHLFQVRREAFRITATHDAMVVHRPALAHVHWIP